ncbi:MAG: F0F1 ATP synthase subunit gamma [Azospirillum brasilense]|nr:MAG: F0F1 ATP synthase subunit gamma [Azospirillum brasilense]
MPSLKDLKVRINSVKSTQKITKAMKMVAASKLRRAREAAEASRPYAVTMEKMLTRLASGYVGQSNAPALLAGTGRDDLQLIIAVTSDRGLAGALNGGIIRSVRKRVRELQAQGKQVRLYCVGRKGREGLAGEFRDIIVGERTDVAKKVVEYSTAESIAMEVTDLIAREGIDVVGIYYSLFKSAIAQVPTYQQLVPLVVEATTGDVAPTEYEPSEEEILADLLPRNLAMQVFKALLESAASEQGARMNAMESATKNAGEMIKKLTLKYNRTRQANITKELIEIISGAEAL